MLAIRKKQKTIDRKNLFFYRHNFWALISIEIRPRRRDYIRQALLRGRREYSISFFRRPTDLTPLHRVLGGDTQRDSRRASSGSRPVAAVMRPESCLSISVAVFARRNCRSFAGPT